MDDAIARYTEALRLKPGYAQAHNNLGLALASSGRVEEGMAHMSEALTLEPGSARVHVNLGLALDRKGRSAEAVRHLDTAFEIFARRLGRGTPPPAEPRAGTGP